MERATAQRCALGSGKHCGQRDRHSRPMLPFLNSGRLGAIEAAHAGVGLRPDDEIERLKTELQDGCKNGRIAPPIDKGAKKAAIAKMTEGGTDPSGVKSQELGITHLAGSHQSSR